MKSCERMVAKAIADAMATIRSDVELGNGPVIEADAVLLNVAYNFCSEAGVEDKAAFVSACDLDDLIDSEAFVT
jgi:hypothetical protein